MDPDAALWLLDMKMRRCLLMHFIIVANGVKMSALCLWQAALHCQNISWCSVLNDSGLLSQWAGYWQVLPWTEVSVGGFQHLVEFTSGKVPVGLCMWMLMSRTESIQGYSEWICCPALTRLLHLCPHLSCWDCVVFGLKTKDIKSHDGPVFQPDQF